MVVGIDTLFFQVFPDKKGTTYDLELKLKRLPTFVLYQFLQ